MVMDAESLTAWMEGYRRAWEQQDADLAESLFAASYKFKETPFTEPVCMPGMMRDYWHDFAVLGQRDIQFGYAILDVAHDQGLVHWRAAVTLEPAGDSVHLDGIALVKLDGAGKCSYFEQWWHRLGGGQAPA